MKQLFMIDGKLINMEQVAYIKPVKNEKEDKELTHIVFSSGYSITAETKFEDILSGLVNAEKERIEKYEKYYNKAITRQNTTQETNKQELEENDDNKVLM